MHVRDVIQTMPDCVKKHINEFWIMDGPLEHLPGGQCVSAAVQCSMQLRYLGGHEEERKELYDYIVQWRPIYGG